MSVLLLSGEAAMSFQLMNPTRVKRASRMSRTRTPPSGNTLKDFLAARATSQPARFRPPLPGPFPDSGVLSESGIECGGEGEEPWETPRKNPSRRCLEAFLNASHLMGASVVTHSSPRLRSGFTLIECLVCVAIMAVMVAMLLPAIQNARESARATQCRSNLAQLGEAFHAYHLTQGALPCGSIDRLSPVEASPDRFLWGWAVQLLPYLGEQNRASGLNASLGVLAPENAAILERIPPSLKCPSSSHFEPIGYAGCHNDRLAPVQADNNGTLTLNSHVRFEELVDGRHQTLLLGEATEVRWAEGTHGSLRNFGAGFGETFVPVYVGVDENAAAQNLAKVRADIQAEAEMAPAEDGAETSDEGSLYDPEGDMSMGGEMDVESEATEGDYYGPQEGDSNRPPSPPVAVTLPISRTIGFWPAHRDGGNFLLADGAVRVVSRSIDLEVLRRLANRLDHQAIGEF